ncbi:DUF6894 family protein [Bradyrhizobium sp. DASA03120]|uniref:DUF6894 family protein n=1 Tax=Bradyrhizobium sp. SMVTL-02 TaxID=3395917 RepID=UPI003F6FBAE0
MPNHALVSGSLLAADGGWNSAALLWPARLCLDLTANILTAFHAAGNDWCHAAEPQGRRQIIWNCMSCSMVLGESVAMKRYYFDIRDGSQFIRDDEGVELADIESARQEATAALSEITREWGRGRPRHQMAVEVRDDRGPILEARFSFVIEEHDVIALGWNRNAISDAD